MKRKEKKQKLKGAGRRGRRRRDLDDPASTSSTLRMRVLDGAGEAFGALGFAETRVEDILKASGVSRPSFYKFFRNKEDAFNALAESTTFSLVQMVRGAVTQATGPVEKLERGVDTYLRWRVSTGAFGRVLEAEARNPSTFASRQREAVLQSIMALFESEVTTGKQIGLDSLTYMGLVAALEAIGNSLIVQANASEEDIERRKNIMMRILLGALSPRNPWDRIRAERAKG